MEQEAPAPLNHTPTDGPARAAALAAVEAVECRPTPVVTYESSGTLAIVGSEAAVLRAVDSLGGDLNCTLVVTELADPDRPAERVSPQATLDVVQGGTAIFNRGTRLKMKGNYTLSRPNRLDQADLNIVASKSKRYGRPWVDMVL